MCRNYIFLLICCAISFPTVPTQAQAPGNPPVTLPIGGCTPIKGWKIDASLEKNRADITVEPVTTYLTYDQDSYVSPPPPVIFRTELSVIPGRYRVLANFGSTARPYQEGRFLAFEPASPDEKLFSRSGHAEPTMMVGIDEAVTIRNGLVEFRVLLKGSGKPRAYLSNSKLCYQGPLPVDANAESKPSMPAAAPRVKDNNIWFERQIAKATTGYDPAKNQTLMSVYMLEVTGPTSIDAAIENFVRDCVEAAFLSGYGAFNATPSPEVGARIAAAWASFHGSLYECLSYKSAASSLRDQFALGYVNRMFWEDGLRLQYTADNSKAELYRKIHALVQRDLPQPLNQVIEFFIRTQEFPKLDVSLKPPGEISHYLSQLPAGDQMRKLQEDASKYAGLDAKKIIQQEFKEQADRLKSDLSNKAQVYGLKLQGDAAKEAEKRSKEFGEWVADNAKLPAGAAEVARCAAGMVLGPAGCVGVSVLPDIIGVPPVPSPPHIPGLP